ncbi:peptidylprolyl isomerase [Flavobacteriales bacterium]|nr:peptidylprolyl isomerase [Flavobacteriales bacterium]
MVRHKYIFLVCALFLSCQEESRPIISANKPIYFEPLDSIVTKTDSVRTVKDTTEQTPGWKRIYQFEAEQRLRSYGKDNKETKFKIVTQFGDIKVRLFKDTPLHRASTVLMIKHKLFNGSRFYRTRKKFIIQGGFTDGPGAYERLIQIGQYKIPSELNPEKHPHIKGAFALAGSDFSPGIERDKKSNPFTFYIVQGSIQNDASLQNIELTYGIKISQDNKNKYKKSGGTPHLDNQYTVCGEVYAGIDVVEKISKVRTNSSEHPQESIYLSIELIK